MYIVKFWIVIWNRDYFSFAQITKTNSLLKFTFRKQNSSNNQLWKKYLNIFLSSNKVINFLAQLAVYIFISTTLVFLYFFILSKIVLYFLITKKINKKQKVKYMASHKSKISHTHLWKPYQRQIKFQILTRHLFVNEFIPSCDTGSKNKSILH